MSTYSGIIELGRGPTIAGSRITVYDVLEETQAGATAEQLAIEWGLETDQIQEAVRYIEAHEEEVLAEYQKIKEHHAIGNPPELQAKIDAMHAKYQALWADRFRAMEQERNGERRSGGQ